MNYLASFLREVRCISTIVTITRAAMEVLDHALNAPTLDGRIPISVARTRPLSYSSVISAQYVRLAEISLRISAHCQKRGDLLPFELDKMHINVKKRFLEYRMSCHGIRLGLRRSTQSGASRTRSMRHHLFYRHTCTRQKWRPKLM